MREIEVTFPDDYQVESLAGQTAVFEVTAKTVQAPTVAAVDEDFVRSFGIDSGSIDELRDGLRRNMERELNQALRKQVKQQVLDALVERNPLEVPQALISDEIGRLREQMQQQLGGQMSADQLGDELFQDEARRRAQVGLILSELVNHTGVQADEESIRSQVQELASAYEDPQQVEQYYYQNQEMLQGVQAMVVEDKVIDWVLANANVTERQSSFDEMMNRNTQSG
ncbi:MAG: trigger factor [Proteobacteria bacterium SW_6_67_9]|nr:MAG: trigger factor [Proteobacteria bacterium SW_6_67_9]